ncbi:hypothetical protein BDA99DRAFT_562237 [Phascolomyces articulosus]|uniref:Uncharacterized protein n=1 Tax=Phascolomyces articulosus TaxID=60185 RepID=A0AAD5JVJ1_9FUNG|nr:hypothetical protein BDA99DRAFT_562237 [Phascolomyces articulosus]
MIQREITLTFASVIVVPASFALAAPMQDKNHSPPKEALAIAQLKEEKKAASHHRSSSSHGGESKGENGGESEDEEDCKEHVSWY